MKNKKYQRFISHSRCRIVGLSIALTFFNMHDLLAWHTRYFRYDDEMIWKIPSFFFSSYFLWTTIDRQILGFNSKRSSKRCMYCKDLPRHSRRKRWSTKKWLKKKKLMENWNRNRKRSEARQRASKWTEIEIERNTPT